MNFTVILTAALVVVGVMELVKKFLPETVSAKVQAIISLVLSAVAGIGFSLAFGITTPLLVIENTAAVIGLVQTSYNFVLKLLREQIKNVEANVEAASK